jgi:hypothetical protein
MKTKG